MTYCCRKECGQGLTMIYGHPDQRVRNLSMGIVSLREEDRFGETLNRRECLIFLLEGHISLKGNTIPPSTIERHADTSIATPPVVYCPPGIFSIKAHRASTLLILRGDLENNTEGMAASVTPSCPRTSPCQSIDNVFSMIAQGTGRLSGGCIEIDARTTSCDLRDIIGVAPSANGTEMLLYISSDDADFSAKMRMLPAENHADEGPYDVRDGDAVIVPDGCRPVVESSSGRAAFFWGMHPVTHSMTANQ